MNKIVLILLVCLFALVAFGTVVAEDSEPANTGFSLWVGSHYTDFTDSPKKVGEYNLGNSEALPEFKLNLLSRSNGKLFSLDGHYYDDQNINANLRAEVGNRMNLSVQYRSMIRQTEQDLLENIAAQEFAGLDSLGNDKRGGKMLTHAITDPGADYNYNRQEILTRLNILLSKKNNVRLVAAHRSILKNGTEQKVASDHCFSCHLTSESAEVDQRTHEIEAGLEAEVDNVDVGYTFGYRKFKSYTADPTAYFDKAMHPIKITDTAVQHEFESRVIFDDSTAPFGTYPETERFSHKVRVKGKLGTGRLASSLVYSTSKNKRTDLSSDAVSGVLNYAVPLSPRTRLIARVTGARLTADDPFIDLPTFRDGRPGPHVDFDYIRYSTIDRTEGKATAEVITRLNPKMTLSVLAGYQLIDRDDYPTPGDGLTTNRFIGQAKLRYRKGLKYSTSLKYRFEKTSDPFTSGRGLFEHVGRDRLLPLVDGLKFIFYFQREALRYQNITTEPTDYHEFVWSSTWRPDPKVNMVLGARGKYDKNNDLDSLDVEHFSIQPNIALNLTPDPRVVVSTGYTLNYSKSRGPVTVALFDG